MWAALALNVARPESERAEALDTFRGVVSQTGVLRFALR